MVNLSVVVLTKNEEQNIKGCLESVNQWANEIIIVDDESMDKTLDIAGLYTDKIIIRKQDVEGKQRNFAYSQAKNLWVLSLDADERVTDELKEEIKKLHLDSLGNYIRLPKLYPSALQQVTKGAPQDLRKICFKLLPEGQIFLDHHVEYNGFTIPRRNYIGDYWVRYGGWYPSPQLKLFRKDKFRYEEVGVHPRAFMDDPCGHLKSDIIHYSYKNIEDFLRKLNNQTTREAQKWHQQNKPMRLGRFLWRAYDRFMRAYFGRKGFLDGFLGFVVAFFAGVYQFLSYLKYRELILKEREKI